jgi:hypothetical protein
LFINEPNTFKLVSSGRNSLPQLHQANFAIAFLVSTTAIAADAREGSGAEVGLQRTGKAAVKNQPTN